MKNIIQSFLFGALFLSAMICNAQTVRTGVDFDGVDDLIMIPNNAAYNFGTGPFTVEMWIQADATQPINPHFFFKKDTIIGATGLTMSLSNSGKLTVGVKGAGHNTGFGPGSPNVADGICHHVVYTRDVSGTDDTLRAYIDGILVKKSVKSIPSADVTHSSAIFIGGASGGFGTEDLVYKGMVKELRLWNIARSGTEISATMDKFLKGNEAGLVGNWRFYENTGTTVKDYSSKKNDGMFLTGTKAPAWADFCDVINDTIPTGPVPTGIDENTTAQTMHYPNPANNQLTWKLEGGLKLINVKVYNALGELVIEDQNPQANGVNVSSLKTGIYFYEIRLSNNEIATNRFIKQ